LLDLIAKADSGNRKLIRKGFPDAVQAYEMWMDNQLGDWENV